MSEHFIPEGTLCENNCSNPAAYWDKDGRALCEICIAKLEPVNFDRELTPDEWKNVCYSQAEDVRRQETARLEHEGRAPWSPLLVSPYLAKCFRKTLAELSRDNDLMYEANFAIDAGEFADPYAGCTDTDDQTTMAFELQKRGYVEAALQIANLDEKQWNRVVHAGITTKLPVVRYETENVEIKAVPPKYTRRWNRDQILAYARDHYRATPDGKPQNRFTAYMKAVSDAVMNPQDWKAPFYARLPQCRTPWVEAVVIWYHGALPQVTFVGVMSPGYQAW